MPRTKASTLATNDGRTAIVSSDKAERTTSVTSRKSKSRRSKSYGTTYLLVGPFLTAFALFYIVPVLSAIYLSLFIKKRSLTGRSVDVFGGFANYARAFSDQDFLHSLSNVISFCAVVIPISIGAAIILALILDEASGRILKAGRTLLMLPYTIPVAIGSLLWGYLYSRNVSPINFVIDHLHLQKVDFLAPNLLVGAIANVVIWAWTGYNMVGIYTALQGIPRDLYEAAKIDGAGRLAVIRHIKLPLVMPAVRVVLLFAVIGTSQIFGEPFILRSLGYIPENVTPNLYIYWIAQRDANYSYSAALAVILAVIVFAITLLMCRRPVKES